MISAAASSAMATAASADDQRAAEVGPEHHPLAPEGVGGGGGERRDGGRDAESDRHHDPDGGRASASVRVDAERDRIGIHADRATRVGELNPAQARVAVDLAKGADRFPDALADSRHASENGIV